MRLAVQHNLVPGANLFERFSRAREYGFDGIELTAWGMPGPIPDYLDEIRDASASAGIPVCSLCGRGEDDFVHPDPSERAKRAAGLARLLDAADVIGAGGVVTLPIRNPHRLKDAAEARGTDERTLARTLGAEQLRAVFALAPDASAAVLLEPLNRYEAWYLKTVADAGELAEASGQPRALVLADLFHMNIEERDMAGAIRDGYERVAHLHLADSNRLLPGHGHTDFVAPFAACHEIGFGGWMALECSVPGGSENAAALLPACVRFLREQWQRAGEAAA